MTLVEVKKRSEECEFTWLMTALMALMGYNKKLRVRPCELVQTAETGCSWELPVPFRIFLFLFIIIFILFFIPFFWILHLVHHSFSSLLGWPKTCQSVGQPLVFCKHWLHWENMCDHWQPLKVQLDYSTGTAVGSVMHWLNREPTQPSGVSGNGNFRAKTCWMKIRKD